MIKPLLLFALFSFFSQVVYCQDLVIKKNGEEIQAKIKQITLTDVRYKLSGNLEGPDFVLPKAEIFMIRFGNGISQVFNEAPRAAAVTIPVAPAQPADPLAPEPVHMEGPRIGATLIGPGKWADKLENDYNANPFISQFGWQFESRLFTTAGGTTGLVEWIPLVGGLDKGLFLPSLSALIGLRGNNGLEIGFGPNVSVAGAGLAMAAGINLHTGYVNIPVNFAVVPSRHGARFSLLTGFNIRKR